AFVFRAAFAGRDASNNASSVLDGLKRVKRALAASDTLHNQAGVLVYKYAHLCSGRRNDLLRSVFHSVRHNEIQSGVSQNLLPLFDVCAFEPDDHWNLDTYCFCCLDDPGCDNIASHDPPEDVNQYGFYMLVG